MANNDVFSALSRKTENNGISAVSGLTEMFGLSVNARMTVLPISQLREKENHPFKVIEDDKFLALADSIRENGLMQPVIVRQIEYGIYEILAGHRRTRACKYNGDKEIKVLVIQADDELANRIMIATNFQQRDTQLPSEIARSYLIRYTDLKGRKRTSDENSTGWNSDEKIDKIMEKEFNTSKSNVYLYLRLNHLITQLMDALDNKKLNIKVAAELSYLTEIEQTDVYELVYEKEAYKLDLKKAKLIKQHSGELSRDDIIDLLESQDRPKDTISFSKSEIKKFRSKFTSLSDMRDAILKFLEDYK